MSVDPSRLRRGEIIAGVAGLALLAIGFGLGWLRSGGRPRDVWGALPVLRWFVLATSAAAEALLVAQATRRAPALPVSLSVVVTALAGLTAILLAIRLVTTGAAIGLGASLGLVATAAIAAGGLLSMRAEQGWDPDPAPPPPGRSGHPVHPEHRIETIPLRAPDDR
ncbi:MAG: hypothetical protein JOZ07_16660 [Solirubrobacterales bacterium]|nr:hypothetical protein [Solirubrobacterales bacterium]